MRTKTETHRVLRLTSATILLALAATLLPGARWAPDTTSGQGNPAAERGPSAALFRDPPIEARVGAYWVWLNGNADPSEITRELEEMKAKGLSGAEIWDIGVIRPNPDMEVPAGPAFLGPESLAAIHHAINEAARLGLRLGFVSSSSWNEGGSWIQPPDAVKAMYVSEIGVAGPGKVTRRLPFPSNRAAKGADGLPLYHQEIAVLAFPSAAKNAITNVASVVNLSDRMNVGGELQWDVPPGEWTVMRFVSATTGQPLVVPSPNSRGLMVDHMDAGAETRNYDYIFAQLLKGGAQLKALKYFQEDSIEIDPPGETGGVADWTQSFIAEFQRRRGYDPTPYLPVFAGKQFADPQIAGRFLHDYRETVSDLWIDGHYRVARAILHQHGLQMAGEPGHGGYPRAEVLAALGSIDYPRGEFWNGKQFWVAKEAASAAHIYGLKYADAESFTGWRSWQDGPFELKRLADAAFCDGMNRLTIHNFSLSPPAAGLPGYMLSRRRARQRQYHLVAAVRAVLCLPRPLLLPASAGIARGRCVPLLWRRCAKSSGDAPHWPQAPAPGRRQLCALRPAQSRSRHRAGERLRLRRGQLGCPPHAHEGGERAVDVAGWHELRRPRPARPP